VAMLILGILFSPASLIWALVDMVFVITGQFRDKDGKLILDWQV
jgi:hypothetical protein